jgi:tetratricopeptide (TPR) repeat protein
LRPTYFRTKVRGGEGYLGLTMISDVLRIASLLLLGSIGAARGAQPSAQAQAPTAKDQAFALEQAHNLPAAEQAWQAILASNPNDAEANAHLGLDFALENNYAQAIPAYRKAAQLKPDLPGLQMNLGLALFKNAQLAEAIQPLTAATAQTPTDPRPKLLLGMAQYGTGHYADAIPNLRAGLDLTPTNLQLRLTLAQSCLWAKDYACALEQDKLILQQDPNSAQADMIAGEAYDAKGDSSSAITQFRAAEAANPNLPEEHFGLGYLLWKEGNYADAEPEFQQELKLEPNHTQALTYLGDLAIKKNDWTTARAVLDKAAAQPNPVRLTHLDLGIVDQHDKRNAEAEANFKRAIELGPDDPDAHYRLARLLQSMGKTEEGRAELTKVQQLHKAKDNVLVQQITPPKQP